MSAKKPVARPRTRPSPNPNKSSSGGHDPHRPVGYANPPKAGQFKKGQSGNPNGRPKGRKSIGTIINERLYQKVTVIERGRERTVPLIEAKVMQLTRAMLKGDEKATSAVFKLLAQYPGDEEPAKRGSSGFTEEDDRRLLDALLSMNDRDAVNEEGS